MRRSRRLLCSAVLTFWECFLSLPQKSPSTAGCATPAVSACAGVRVELRPILSQLRAGLARARRPSRRAGGADGHGCEWPFRAGRSGRGHVGGRRRRARGSSLDASGSTPLTGAETLISGQAEARCRAAGAGRGAGWPAARPEPAWSARVVARGAGWQSSPDRRERCGRSGPAGRVARREPDAPGHGSGLLRCRRAGGAGTRRGDVPPRCRDRRARWRLRRARSCAISRLRWSWRGGARSSPRRVLAPSRNLGEGGPVALRGSGDGGRSGRGAGCRCRCPDG